MTTICRRLDVASLINDLGGPARVHGVIGGSRYTPYRCMKTGRISAATLERILSNQEAFGIEISLDRYTTEMAA
jgi:hypothetical protein